MKHSSFDEMISALHAETSAITRSYQRYRRGIFGDISDCGVGITPQMCNRVTNHGDMGTFSKPGQVVPPTTSRVTLVSGWQPGVTRLTPGNSVLAVNHVANNSPVLFTSVMSHHKQMSLVMRFVVFVS